MARHNDNMNPSDLMGLVGSGSMPMGIVIDVNDPKKLGRIKVRRMDQDKNLVPDDKLPWISCGFNNQPSMFGMGASPPNYQNGSKVLLASLGQQGYTVLMSIPNSETTEGRKDIHEDTSSKEHRIPETNQATFKKYAQIFRTTTDALGTMNKTVETWQKATRDHAQGVDLSPTPDQYNLRKAAKDAEGAFPVIATTLFQMPKNPQEYIKGIVGDQSSVVKTSLDMLNNLKDVAKNPLGAPMPTPSIGAQNILQALQFLAQLLNDQSIAEDTPVEIEQDEITGYLYQREEYDTLTGTGT